MNESFRAISERMAQAANRVGRDPEEVTLVAASKGVPLERIQEAVACGVAVFGENRVQEGRTKFLDTGLLHKIRGLHLIGPLQSNKVNKAVGVFDVIHSVDSLRLAEKIAREAERQGIRQAVLIEVNMAGEASKHGVSVPDLEDLASALRRLPGLSLLGLMAIPPKSSDPEASRVYFASLHRLGQGLGLSRLSMGMSSDFEVAIEEGATWVRIGRGLFGERAA